MSDFVDNFRCSYKDSNSHLDRAEQCLIQCEAQLSPGLDTLSERITAARTALQGLWKQRNSSGLTSPISSTPRPRFFSMILNKVRPDRETALEKMHKLESDSHIIAKEASSTSTRREGYMTLYNIISIHMLPAKSDLYCETLGLLTLDDKVLVTEDVIIHEGSYLDSSKYCISGPKIVTLAQKTINFIAFVQNPPSRLERYQSDLKELAIDIYQHTLRIACDMRHFPEDGISHIAYINIVNRVLHIFSSSHVDWSGPVTGILANAQMSKWALKEFRQRLYQSRLCEDSPTEGNQWSLDKNSRTSYEITLCMNGKSHTHKIADLNWKYVWEEVLPPMGITVVEVTKYKLAHHARGGFAAIYEARLPDGTKVALKHPRGNEPGGVLCLRFIRELFVWWEIGDHSGIHKLLGVYFMEQEKIPVIVSSWCDDGDLSSFLQGRRQNRAEQLKLALQIARGLQHLHSQKIVHGDLKPNNILIEGGQAKLHDFGISRIQDDANGLSTKAHGSYAYQAPEVLEALKKPSRPHTCVTSESDIYSFANVLFECLTQEIPFGRLSTSSKDAIYQAVVEEFKRPLHLEYGVKISGECKDELARLIKDCWHRDPVQRPSADEVVIRLEEIEAAVLASSAAP